MRLATAQSADPDFPAMASAQARLWRSTLASFAHGATFPWRPQPIGADMELWAAVPQPGTHPERGLSVLHQTWHPTHNHGRHRFDGRHAGRPPRP